MFACATNYAVEVNLVKLVAILRLERNRHRLIAYNMVEHIFATAIFVCRQINLTILSSDCQTSAGNRIVAALSFLFPHDLNFCKRPVFADRRNTINVDDPPFADERRKEGIRHYLVAMLVLNHDERGRTIALWLRIPPKQVITARAARQLLWVLQGRTAV